MDDQHADPVVLLVDDDEMERFLHRQALEPAGFEIVEAEDGVAALEAFAISLPDIVILDLMMPQMDGFALCQAIRATPAGRNIPILVATGLDDVESIERAYRIGATDFIAKPISCTALPHRLRYMLRTYHLAEAQRISGLGHFRWMPNKPRVECSPEMSQMFGMAGGTPTHLAKSLLRRVFPADRPSLIRALRNAFQGDRIELDHRIVTPEGGVRTVLLQGEVPGTEGMPKYRCASYQDVTERKRVETQLAAARDEAREASAAKTAFLEAMSHELFTPLNAIIGFSDLILQETRGPISQPSYLEFAHNIRGAGQRALAACRDVVMLAELEADRFPMNLEAMDLCEAIKAAVAEFHQTDAGADRVVVFKAAEKRLAVHADRGALAQMLRKLRSNAAKFSLAGKAIEVSIDGPRDGSIRVSVADTGIGMTPEDVALAIQPFGQIGSGLTRPYEGLGLGLTIVSRLIVRHSGHLTTASELHKGTKISLDFPVPTPRGQSEILAKDVFLTDHGVAPA
jgi:signal transduction histidine kinase